MRGWLMMVLVGCSAGPIELPRGAYQTGQAAFGANPAGLDGLYVPALAGCTVTDRPYPGADPAEWAYDRDGRLVRGPVMALLMGAGPVVSYPTPVELVWEGPCVAGWEGLLVNYAETRVCDDMGWPVEAIRTYDGDFDFGRSWERWYDGERLVEEEEFVTLHKGAQPVLEATATIEWDDRGRPTVRDRREATGPDSRTDTVERWFWRAGRLDRWTYQRDGEFTDDVSVDEQNLAYDERGRLSSTWGTSTWEYNYDDARDRWPASKSRGKAPVTTVQVSYDCPEP